MRHALTLAASAAFLLCGVLPSLAAQAHHVAHKAGIVREAPPAVSNDFGGGNSSIQHKHRYGVSLNPLATCQSLWNSTIIANGKGLITGPVMNAAFNCVPAIVNAQGTFVGGTWYPAIPAGAVGALQLAPSAVAGALGQAGGDVTGPYTALTVNQINGRSPYLLVTTPPTRVATGSSAVTTATDYLVCLNGPTTVSLEAAPPSNTTHVLKDCRTNGGAAIVVLPAGTDTIDGGSSLSLTIPHQAVTLTYITSLGWENY